MLEKYKNYRRIYPRLRLSYSLLTNYWKGDFDKVWKYLMGIQDQVTYAMNRGKKLHEDKYNKGINDEIKKNIFIESDILLLEQKFIYQYDFDVDFVFIPDVICGHSLGDYKTGQFNKDHVKQLYLYRAFLQQNGNLFQVTDKGKKVNDIEFKIDKGILMHLTGELDVDSHEVIMFNEQDQDHRKKLIENVEMAGKDILDRIRNNELNRFRSQFIQAQKIIEQPKEMNLNDFDLF